MVAQGSNKDTWQWQLLFSKECVCTFCSLQDLSDLSSFSQAESQSLFAILVPAVIGFCDVCRKANKYCPVRNKTRNLPLKLTWLKSAQDGAFLQKKFYRIYLVGLNCMCTQYTHICIHIYTYMYAV